MHFEKHGRSVQGQPGAWTELGTLFWRATPTITARLPFLTWWWWGGGGGAVGTLWTNASKRSRKESAQGDEGDGSAWRNGGREVKVVVGGGWKGGWGGSLTLDIALLGDGSVEPDQEKKEHGGFA